jgi:hypothetical protein
MERRMGASEAGISGIDQFSTAAEILSALKGSCAGPGQSSDEARENERQAEASGRLSR